MKKLIVLWAVVAAALVVATEKQKSNFEFQRDDLVTDLIFRGINKEAAVRAVGQIEPELLRQFLEAPLFFAIVDSSGRFREGSIAKHITADGSKGILYVVHIKSKVSPEHNGQPAVGENHWWYQIEEIN